MTKPQRRVTGALGTKLLLMTGALGLTLGGWGMLAANEHSITTEVGQVEIMVVAPAEPPGLPPIPTVAPLMAPEAIPEAPAAAAAQAPAPTLRAVPAVPAVRPVARTRSSR
jgi:hypothetical protein